MGPNQLIWQISHYDVFKNPTHDEIRVVTDAQNPARELKWNPMTMKYGIQFTASGYTPEI